jgi:N-acetylneuraminic acid mutarotase
MLYGKHAITMLAILSLAGAGAQQVPSLQWSIAATLPPMADGRAHIGVAGPVAGVHNNVLLVAGGANFPEGMPWDGGKKQYHTRGYLYSIEGQGQLTRLDVACNLPETVAYAGVATTPAGIVCAGGETVSGPTAQAWLITIQAHSNTLSIEALPALPVPTTNAAATSNGHLVYLAGGETPNGPANNVWQLNLKNIAAGWKALPNLPQSVSHAVLAAIPNQNGKATLYLAGGRCKMPNGISTIYNNCYSLGPGDTTWQSRAPLPAPLSAASSVVAPSGLWMVFSGDKGATFSQVEKLLVQIAAEKDTNRQQILIEQKNRLQRLHPGFSADVWVYHPDTNSWQVAGSIPFAPPVTTQAVVWKNHVYLCSGEIKAGVRSPDILQATLPSKNHRK